MDDEALQILKEHEKHSATHANVLETELKHLEGIAMGHDGVTDTITNVFKPGHEAGGVGGMGGLGGGLLGGILAGALVGNRRGGLFGGNGDGDGGAETRVTDTVFATTSLNKLGNIEAAIPLAASQTENVVNSTAAATKDAVQNLALFLSNQLNTVNQNVSEQGCKSREITQAGTTAVLQALAQAEVAQLRAELAESRSSGRSRDIEVNVSQNVNQQQAQIQAQAQIATLSSAVNALVNSHQDIRQGIVNLGSMVGSGNMRAANTQVV